MGRPGFLESLLSGVSIQLRISYTARRVMSSGSSSSDRAVIRSRVVSTRVQPSETRTVSHTTTRVHPSESRTVTTTRIQPVESRVANIEARTVSHTTTRVVKQMSSSSTRGGKTVTETTVTASKSATPQVRTVTRTTTRLVASPSKKAKVGLFSYFTCLNYGLFYKNVLIDFHIRIVQNLHFRALLSANIFNGKNRDSILQSKNKSVSNADVINYGRNT